MPDSELCRVQAAAYLRLAQSCEDPILAEELCALSRQFSVEAERQDRRKRSPSEPVPNRRGPILE
jgi:hypothetical protein